MRCACIDIGSNTTRVLVADVLDGRLEEVMVAREFTRLGRELRRTGALPDPALEAVAHMVARQRSLAVEAGAQRLRVVATAAIRAASNRAELCHAVQTLAGVRVDILDGAEEARLAFEGAARTLPDAPSATIGVVDVGGGSTEIAVGTLAEGVGWSVSVPVGSGLLADAYLHGDPPGPEQLEAAQAHAARAFDPIEFELPALGVAVGGSATSMRRLVGPTIDAHSVAYGLGVLGAAPAESVARNTGLAAERVRLLPAGLIVLAEASSRLGRPLEVGYGGLREGVCLHLGSIVGA